MPARWIAVLAAMLLIAAAQPSARSPDAVLQTAMSEGKIPAMGMLIMRHGRVSEVVVRGVRRQDGADPVRPDDVWHIGSDAKAMTATMIARLVERGVMDWDTPLEKMLPDLAAGMRPEYRAVTLRQLLSHHAGLPHDLLDQKAFNNFYADTRPLPVQRLAYIAAALQESPVNPPGTAYSYSNTGYVIAAVAAERATGKSYEDLMRREVFGPLDMRSVAFGVTGEGQPRGHLAGRVAGPGDGNPLLIAPAGNVHLSLEDWAKFCLDQMAGANGHGRLLKTTSYRRLQTPVADDGSGYALGWVVLPSAAGREGPVLTHSGSDTTMYADAVLFPSTESGVLVVANAGPDMGSDKAVPQAVRAVLPQLAPVARKIAK
ncbi:MAG TPA: serine hydrolase domain-containing protein [Caulobacteraceae bacterium]|jgi:CubicO group peptidase (beta-lactamase class C family)